MSYKCNNCDHLQEFATRAQQIKAKKLKVRPKLPTQALKLVIEIRPKKYQTKIYRRIKGKKKEIIIRSEGHEIVREWDLCIRCYDGLRPKNS